MRVAAAALGMAAALLAGLKADWPLGCKWGPLIPVPVQIHSEVLSRLAWLRAPRTVMDELTQWFAVSHLLLPLQPSNTGPSRILHPWRAGVRVHSCTLSRFFSGLCTFSAVVLF